LAVTQVPVSGQDPNALDRSTADQPLVAQIQGDQQAEALVHAHEVANDVAAMFGAPQPPPGALSAEPSPGYQLSPEEIDEVIRQLTPKVQRFDQYLKQIEPFVGRDLAPAQDEPGSKMHAAALRRGFHNMYNAVKRERDKTKAWLDLMTTTKQAYIEQEHLTAQQWTRLTLGLQP
jgi:hypothetical protein